MRFPIAADTWYEDWFEDDRGSGHRGPQIHQGIDVFAPRGTPIVAPSSGTVESNDDETPLSGYWVRLKGDNGHTWFFGHLDEPSQVSGHVPEGTIIGKIGNSGNARNRRPHAHIELRINGVKQNPYPLLKELEAEGIPIVEESEPELSPRGTAKKPLLWIPLALGIGGTIWYLYKG